MNKMAHYLHVMSDGLLVLQDLLQGLHAESVAQRGGGKQARRVLRISNSIYRLNRVEDLYVDNGIHGHRYRVLGQDLLRWHVERDRAQVDDLNGVYAGYDEEEAWSLGST